MTTTANELDTAKDNSVRPRVKDPMAEDPAREAGKKATPLRKNHNEQKPVEPNSANSKKQKYTNITLDNFHTTFGKKAWTPYLTLKTERELSAMKLDFELIKINASKEMRFTKKSPWSGR